MSMIKWAENEVRIACERENPNRKEGEFDYGCACYESALKAYKCLCEDGHSGLSFSITRQILNRLMEGKPLTPIEDCEENWNRLNGFSKEKEVYQCKRMSSLFKDIYPDGMSDTQINDIFWFEDDWIAEMLGYEDFEAIMHRDDEEEDEEEDEDEDEEEEEEEEEE